MSDVSFKMCTKNVRCLKSYLMVHVIGRCLLVHSCMLKLILCGRSQERWLMCACLGWCCVPLVDVARWCVHAMDDVNELMCIHYIWCVQALVVASFNWMMSLCQCTQDTSDVTWTMYSGHDWSHPAYAYTILVIHGALVLCCMLLDYFTCQMRTCHVRAWRPFLI